ncbi:MAG: hypothetical protein ABSB58_10270 [Gemmatimonadales bacterium]|jgi:hypothetical protein
MAVTRSLAAGLVLVAACATARPVFEQSFGPSQQSMGRWLHLLSTRYGCDSIFVSTRLIALLTSAQDRAPSEINRDMRVCDEVAIGKWPMRVQAWQTSGGVREEWVFQRRALGYGPGTAGGSFIVYLEGPDPLALCVTTVTH